MIVFADDNITCSEMLTRYTLLLIDSYFYVSGEFQKLNFDEKKIYIHIHTHIYQ